MTSFLKLLQWVLKAAVFFTLFAFALNNQHEASVHFFFGTQWRSPMVLVVLAAFAIGVAVGVLGMVPRWWRHRQLARQAEKTNPPPLQTPPPASDTAEHLHAWTYVSCASTTDKPPAPISKDSITC
jgi:uncharacterized integral membrane protein